jgi:RimJ/RimL family protein N-acetyltransferase
MNDDWRLRQACLADTDVLHALGCKPPVYRYLFDASPPTRAFIAGRIAEAVATAADTGLGMWLLCCATQSCAGCVQLQLDRPARSAELTYLLDPLHWGRGLALRMAWTAITQAFQSGHVDTIIAGADEPNAASFRLMHRLGMRFHRHVRYPLGAGREYALRRGEAGPVPSPTLLPID